MRTCFSAAGLMALVLAGSAVAQPAVFDRVPAGSALIVVTKDMQAAAERAKPLAALMGAQGELPGQELTAMADKLLLQPGVKKDGSLVLIMPTAPKQVEHVEGEEVDEEGAPPVVLILVPVTDYKAFVTGLGGKGEGVTEVEIEGQPVCIRDLGDGVALMGGPREAIEGYKGVTGQMAAHKARLGPAGRRIADSSDMVIVADAQAFKEQIESGKTGMGLGGGMGGIGAMAGGMDGPGEAIANLRKAIARDGQTAIMGMGGGEAGYTLDVAGVFKEGTESAKMFAKNGDSAALMSKLPAQSFYLAGAFDMSAEGVRSLMSGAGGGGDEESVPSAFDALTSAMGKADGVAVVVGANKAGPMAGIFINTVAYISTKDSKGMLEAFRANGEKMKDTSLGGTKVKTDYKKDVAEASGVKFDAWSTTITPDPNDPNAFMAGMMMQTLFGQSRGFGQMAAAMEGGLVMTMSQNTPLMSSAIEAVKTGKGLGQDAGLAAVRAHLPPNRSMEMYLGTQAIMDAALPMAEDYLGEEIAVPKNVPPVAMAGSMEEGSMSIRLFVPMGVIRAAESIMKAMKAAEDGLEPMDGGT